MEWEFKVDQTKFRQLVERYPKALALAMREAIHKAMLRFFDVFKDLSLSGRPGLNRRTGALLHSFVVGVSASTGRFQGLETWLASGSKYAGIHEHGGTVRSNRPGGFLAIPLPGTLTKAGVIKGMSVAGMIQEGSGLRQSLRSIPGLFVVAKGSGEKTGKGKKAQVAGLRGTAFLCEARGKGIVPLFVLKRSVYIPPRLRFFETFRRWVAKPGFQRFFRNAVESTWNSVKK